MTSWYYKPLGDGITAGAMTDQIREEFLTSYTAAGYPEDMAVFTRSDSEDRLHCEIFVYFSPAAAAVAKVFDAQPCEIPLRGGLDLLAGNAKCWQTLFSATWPDKHHGQLR
jgi:hypothetical protein